MKRLTAILLLIATVQLHSQTNTQFNSPSLNRKWSQELAQTAMTLWKDSFLLEGDKFAKWRYDQGVILKGIEGIWNATGNGDYFRYIQKSMDFYVNEDGSIKGYRPDEFNIDHINNGKLLLTLYRVTGKEKYKKAADHLRGQLRHHPRTSEGGFWHKKIYPWQMWLDGLYMGQPFYAEYAMLFHEDTTFNDITRQFVLMEKHSRDTKTGLLYHGWDESREQQWANKKTGLSPNVWGRALGWYGMAMVDVLDYFPANHPGRKSIIAILNRFAQAITKVQDSKSGLWYDVVDKKNEPKNYVEASASSMLVYTLAKGVRKGYLPQSYLQNAKRGYEGIIKEFIRTENGQVNLHGTVQVSGLGGKPYRDGSFEYYMSEPVIVNDPKGMGAFINCAVEMEMVNNLPKGKGKTVALDYYYNNEWKKDATGKEVRYHYTWEDRSNGGFAMLGEIFRMNGVQTRSLDKAPTAQLLKGVTHYIIVDPDTEKETNQPNLLQQKEINAIAEWVKAGGTLVLMGNDAGNAEFTNFNKLATKFGITFNEDSRNRVQGNNFDEGEELPGEDHPIFSTAKKLYLKEVATLRLNTPATSVLMDGDDAIMAVSRFGKGTVFAVGDPWIYNEYIDGRKLPADFQNYQAATDLVNWLISNKPIGGAVKRKSSASLKKIIVSPDGKGDYKTIQGAINELPQFSSSPRVIFIKNGIYNEKLYIEKHNVILEGESRANTIITQSIARDAWRCLHNDDWGVATMNVDGNDITLRNLTVINSFGFDWKKDETISCPIDTVNKQKTITKNSHQMALRTMNGTRLKAINCHFKAFGGDTVSPWNVEAGLFYFKDCVMEGGVDFYCPRGWAFAENCEFITHSGTAAIWHDGSRNAESKTVLKNCVFKGFDGFKLGRYHRDAQFYLLNCVFADNMANENIYQAQSSPGVKWGHRVYYYNCHRKAGDYAWHADNLSSAPGNPDPVSINAAWVFGNRWQLEEDTK